MKEISKFGTELEVNDFVSVWWRRKGVRLLELRPHPKYEEMFGVPGAMIGNFDGTEMTIEPHMVYKVFVAS
jgi:hypothetical protein